MKFGRLEIFKPDEPIENFVIAKEILAIGRQPGNDLVLERNGVSRYHANLTFRDNQMLLTDLESVNKTYVDGLPINANEPRLLRGGEEIQIGDVRLIYHPHNEVIAILETETQRLELPTFLLSLEGPFIAVAPGAHAQAFLTIENLTDVSENFHIRVEGVPKEWVRVDRNEIDIEPRANERLGITFKPLRRSTSVPGEYYPVAKVYADANPNEVAEIKTKLIILPYGGYGMVLATPTIEGSQPFQLYVHNQGNAPLTLSYSGRSKSNKIVVEFREARVTLKPGEKRTISGTVRPTNKLAFGKPQEYSFDILSQAHDASRFLATVSGKYRFKPLLPIWTLALSSIGFVAIAGLFVLLMVVLLSNNDNTSVQENDDNDTVNEIDGNAAPVVRLLEAEIDKQPLGNTFFISWNIEGADSVDLRFSHPDGTVLPYDGLEATQNNYPFPPSLAGIYDLKIIAHYGDNQVYELEQNRFLEVQPRLELTVDNPNGGNGVYRNLTQTISLSWEVRWSQDEAAPLPEAIEIFLNSNNPALGFDNTSVRTTNSPFTVTLPQTTMDVPLEFTLTSQGYGIEQSETVSLPILYPTCDLLSMETPFYERPDLNTLILTPPRIDRQTVYVDSRDASGTWLKLLSADETATPLGWTLVTNVGSCVFTDMMALAIADLEASTPSMSTAITVPTLTLTPAVPTSSPTTPTATASPVSMTTAVFGANPNATAETNAPFTYVVVSNDPSLNPPLTEQLQGIGQPVAPNMKNWVLQTLFTELPTIPTNNFVIIIYNVGLNDLAQNQRQDFQDTLEEWVENGGHLIVHISDQSTAEAFRELLPTTINININSIRLNFSPVANQIGFTQSSWDQEVLIIPNKPKPNTAPFIKLTRPSDGTSIPLVVRKQMGQGIIDAVAVSPIEPAFRNLPQRELLWKYLIETR